MVHSGRYASSLRGVRAVYGKLQHVRPRRRLSRCEGSHGREDGKTFRLCPDVRLHSYRTHQWRVGRPLLGRVCE